jgi:hypothetical protein
MEQVYKLVDQIYCINLISRPDRYAHMKAFESEEKIKINFYRPERDICGGAVGCFKSHISVISQAYQMGYNQVLVLEDDLIKTSAYSNGIVDFKSIAKFIKKNKSWEIIQFSWTSPVNSIFYPMSSPAESSNLSQFGSCLTSSYIVNRNGMKRILSTYKNHLGVQPVDNYYCKIFKKTMWNVVPMPFDQDRNISSDNDPLIALSNGTIENIFMSISVKFNLFYNISLFKYYNGCFVLYAIIIFLIIKNKILM